MPEKPPSGVGVRISSASPEVDLAAVVWPGVSIIYCPRAESAEQMRAADAVITRLERTRGLRPGTVELRPLIETARGVTMAGDIGASSARIRALGVGPNIQFAFAGDARAYASAACEFQARALNLEPLDFAYVPD